MTVQSRERLAVLLDRLEPAERQAWQDQIDRARTACGCSEGTAGLLLGVVAAVVAVVAGAGWVPDRWWQGTLLVLGGALAGAIVGKAFGQARGRYRARRLTAALAARGDEVRG